MSETLLTPPQAVEGGTDARGTRWRAAARLAAAIALVALGATTLLVAAQVQPIWFGDADWYAAGVRAIGGGQPLYPAAYLQPHVAVRPPAFNQPPAAVLLAPLAALGRVPWGALMAVALLAGIALAWPRLPGVWGWVLAGAVMIWIPVPDAVIWATLNSVVLLLLAVAVRWPRQAGWAIGAAAALRLAPVFLFAWLIGRRDWRGVLTAAGVAIGLTLLAAALTSPSVLWDFVVVRWFEAPQPHFGEFSLATLGLPPAVGYVVAAGLAILAMRRASLSLSILAALVAVPDLHYHYWILLLVPLLRLGEHPYAVDGETLRAGARWLRAVIRPA